MSNSLFRSRDRGAARRARARRARLLDRRAPAPRENLRKTIKTRRGRRSAADTRLRELKRGSKPGGEPAAPSGAPLRPRGTGAPPPAGPAGPAGHPHVHDTGHGRHRPSARARRGGGRGGGGVKISIPPPKTQNAGAAVTEIVARILLER